MGAAEKLELADAAAPPASQGPDGPDHAGQTTFWVDAHGRILDCCRRAQCAFGYPAGELIGSHVSRLFPQLAGAELLQGGNVTPRLAFRCRCATFRAVGRDGSQSDCILFVNAIGMRGHLTIIALHPVVRPRRPPALEIPIHQA